MPKKISVMDEEWDYLIILDACRYDYFSKLYKNYLRGKLENVYSVASCTQRWCMKSFKGYYDDVVYISANPHINSKGEVRGFTAKKHFFKVIDVWDSAWNEKIGTVPPQKVNEAVENLKDKFPNKRFIIHFIQPHAPYLIHTLENLFPRPHPKIAGGIVLRNLWTTTTSKILNKLLKLFALVAKRIGVFGGNPSWKIRELLNLPPEKPMDAVRRKVGVAGLRKAYVENLKLVLAYVAELVENLSGLIVITSDHGELLGENDCYGHPCGSTNPLLREVPWLTIKKGEKRKRVGEKKRIMEEIKRLKALKRI